MHAFLFIVRKEYSVFINGLKSRISIVLSNAIGASFIEGILLQKNEIVCD